MLRQLLAKPWLVLRVGRTLAELQTNMHRQDGSLLPPPREALRATLGIVDGLSASLKERLHEMLDALPDGRALCHFDFHPDQVLLTAEGPIIIDWMTAYAGHPLADVARTSIILTAGSVPHASPAKRAMLNRLRRRFHRAYLAQYLRLNPGSIRADIEAWIVLVAAGRLREEVPGEREWLLNFIHSNLPAK